MKSGMVRQLTAAALSLLAVSCAPQTSTPVKVKALLLSSNGEYSPTDVELTTVTDIVALEGQVAKMQGGATIRVDPNDPEVTAAQTEETFELAILKETGRPVTASYITDEKGVLWPADFHTWNLVTTYYNLERAWNYFTTVGNMPKADLPQTRVFYFPEFVLADASDKPQRDNALFYSPVKSFVVLPFETLQSAPLAINASILAHEYSHLVFNRRTYGGAALPVALTTWAGGGTSTPGLNVLKALDEGLADFHAYAASCESPYGCNSRILFSSFSEQQVNARDISKNVCMSADLYVAYTTSSINVISGLEYQVGTILASALFKSSTSAANRQVLVRAIIDAYSDESPSKLGFKQLTSFYLNQQGNFTMARAMRALVQHIPRGNVDLRQSVCTNLATSLQIRKDELTGGEDDCPASTTTTTSCPSIYDTP